MGNPKVDEEKLKKIEEMLLKKNTYEEIRTQVNCGFGLISRVKKQMISDGKFNKSKKPKPSYLKTLPENDGLATSYEVQEETFDYSLLGDSKPETEHWSTKYRETKPLLPLWVYDFDSRKQISDFFEFFSDDLEVCLTSYLSRHKKRVISSPDRGESRMWHRIQDRILPSIAAIKRLFFASDEKNPSNFKD